MCYSFKMFVRETNLPLCGHQRLKIHCLSTSYPNVWTYWKNDFFAEKYTDMFFCYKLRSFLFFDVLLWCLGISTLWVNKTISNNHAVFVVHVSCDTDMDMTCILCIIQRWLVQGSHDMDMCKYHVTLTCAFGKWRYLLPLKLGGASLSWAFSINRLHFFSAVQLIWLMLPWKFVRLEWLYVYKILLCFLFANSRLPVAFIGKKGTSVTEVERVIELEDYLW